MNSKNVYASSNLNSLNVIEYQSPYYIKQTAIELREKLLEVIYNIYPKDEAIFL